MLPIEVTQSWRQSFPGAHIGLLWVGGIENSRHYPELDKHKRQLEMDIRTRYSGYDRPMLIQLEVLGAYKAFYRRFSKTYHVLLQLESVIAGKSLPSVNPKESQ